MIRCFLCVCLRERILNTVKRLHLQSSPREKPSRSVRLFVILMSSTECSLVKYGGPLLFFLHSFIHTNVNTHTHTNTKLSIFKIFTW